MEHVINMGLIEDLAGRGINRALQMSTAGISDEQYKDMVETMYETGGAIQDLADMLAGRSYAACWRLNLVAWRSGTLTRAENMP